MKPVVLRPGAVWVLVAYAVALHALVFVAVWKTNFVFLAKKTLNLAPHEEHELPLYRAMLAGAERDRSVPPGAVIVLGDSMLLGVEPARVGPEVHSYALGGATIRTLGAGLGALRSLDDARAIVLGIGVNDLKYREPAEIAVEYAALLARFPADVPVVAVPILPVAVNHPAVARNRFLAPARLRALEEALAAVTAARPRTTRIAPDAFMGPDGGLRAELHGDDGWHLSPAGKALLDRLLHEALEGLDGGRGQ